MSTDRLRRLFLLGLLLALLAGAPFAAADDGKKEDEQVGQLLQRIRPRKSAPAEEVPGYEAPAQTEVEKLAGGAGKLRLDWQAEYRKDPTASGKEKLSREGLSRAARSTLDVAKGRDRGECVKDLTERVGAEGKPLIRNLDVGRHEILKALYARAIYLTQQELKAKGKSPLGKAITVNSGGTGDYTRDQDVTLFAGDPSQETVFFQNLARAGQELGLETNPGTPDAKSSGVDFPQIEVTVFKGGLDLPDSRFATDVQAFQVKYAKGLQKQILNPEAYIGGGADIEVKGRRRPGEIHVQEYRIDAAGNVSYDSEIPGNTRETGSLFHGTAPERFHDWQLAAHVFNNFVQGYRHSKHPGQLDKGSLKYTGRTIEKLCMLYGKLPWKDLPPEEKVELLRKIYPQFDPGTESGRKALEGMVATIDLADAVKRTKKIPKGTKNVDNAAVACQIFMRRAAAVTAAEMARQMLEPPHFKVSWMTAAEMDAFRAMTPAGRRAAYLKRDKVYRECVSVECTENLVATMAILRQIDMEEGGPGRPNHGEATIRRMIEGADPALRPLLRDIADYSKLYLELHLTPDPAERERVRGDLVDARAKLAKTIGEEAPGLRILEEMERLGPNEYLKRDIETGRCPSPAMAEVKAHFLKHLKEAFPSMKEEYRLFRTEVEMRGLWGRHGYLQKKLKSEVCQLDTIADGLQIVEMYQNGAGWKDYTYFVTLNVLSRFHWSFSQFVAAGQIYFMDPADNEKRWEAFKDVGKNLVFMTLCRVVPWAATAKIVFDIMRGTVMITVGYSINIVNRDLVDAMYTGEAGRLDDAAAGTVGGRIRDSGFCVLPEGFVHRGEDEKTGEPFLWIDRPGVYRHFFREWTGLEAHDLPQFGTRTSTRNDALVKANDALARIFYRQAAEYDRAWVSTKRKKRVTLMVTGSEVEEAIKDIQREIGKAARETAQKVLDESAVRTYRSILDKEGTNVILEGLTQRLGADVLVGMMEFWESWITAQIIAMRDIERTAAQADLGALAHRLGEEVEKAIQRKPAKPPEFSCEVDARIYGTMIPGTREYDGSEPLEVSAVLTGHGEVGEHQQAVKFVVVPVRTEIEEEGDAERGTLARETLKVQVVANRGAGPVLAESPEKSYLVRMPPEEEEDGTEKVIPIYRHEERRDDGTLWQVYTYFKSFLEMPEEWESEYGKVYHGKFEEFARDETIREERNYEYGRLDGVTRIYDGKGRLVHTIGYKDGKHHGPELRIDPDSKARLEIDNSEGEMVAQRSFSEEGVKLRDITYEWDRDGGGVLGTASGTAQAWWTNGAPRWKGRFEHSRVDLNDRGGYDGESFSRRVGEWEWFHEDGSLFRRATFVDGKYHGHFEERSEAGHLVQRGTYVNGARTGAWEFYHENGKLKAKGELRDGKKNGVWEEFSKEGVLERRATWADDELSGPCETFFPDGRSSSKGAYTRGFMTGKWRLTQWDGSYEEGPYEILEVKPYPDAGPDEPLREASLKHGDWIAVGPGGRPRWKGAFAKGLRTGAWTFYHENGNVSEEGEYAEDERTGAWTSYWEAGGKRETGSYTKGVKTGRWEGYDDEGKRTNWTLYGEDGRIEDTGWYED